jgi:hypothetical protein
MNHNANIQEIDVLAKKNRFSVSDIAAHSHTGADSLQVSYNDLVGKILVIQHTLPGTSAATAANYGVFFTAPFDCTVIAFSVVFETAGSVNAQMNLEKLTGTQAPDSGVEILNDLSLTGAANTVQYGVINKGNSGSVPIATLNKGDRLCLKDELTMTSVAGLNTVTTISF